MTAATDYLKRLISQAADSPAVTAAYVGGALAREESDPFGELDLYLVAPDGLSPDVPGWVAPLGATALAMPVADGCRVVTPDGLAINITVAAHPEAIRADGLRLVFNRGDGELGEPVPRLPDPGMEAARFWDGIFRAGAAIGRGWPFTAHGELERCRQQLIDLYRLALAPGAPSTGWHAAETLPGGERILEGLREWLVCPLDARAQWRGAQRLASSYESLMLPLMERLGLPYPMAMRNLAFRRLDEIRPDRRPDEEMAVPPQEPDMPTASAGPARFKAKGRIARLRERE
jgi:hypothetical protein